MKLSQRRMSRPSLGGMMATRQGAIILALVCAICATGILLFALGRYKATVKQPTVVPQATVLVATAEIPKGVSGDQIAAQTLYRSVPVAASQVSAGAIADASELAGRQTTTAILAGQQLTTADLSPQVRIVNSLAPDQRAISITISDIAGSIPLLETGDEVDLYTQFPSKQGGNFNVLLERGVPVLSSPTPTATASTPAAPGGTTTTSATTSTAAAPAASGGAGNLVLGVTTSQVARVIYAAMNGQLYVALRPTKANHTPAVITNQGSVVAGSLSDPTTGAHP